MTGLLPGYDSPVRQLDLFSHVEFSISIDSVFRIIGKSLIMKGKNLLNSRVSFKSRFF